MIMARNEDSTYSQVGFVKDNNGVDTEYIYDKDGDIVFEKGFTREIGSTVPLTINGIGKNLKDWSITGNGTPTPDAPVDVQGCGERTENLFDGSRVYKTQVGITIQSLGQYLRINGTKKDGANVISIKNADITLEAGTYTLSVELVSGTVSNATEGVYFGINRSTYEQRTTPAVRDYGTRGLRTFTLSESTKVTSFDITCGYGDAGAVYTDAVFACMLVKGSTALPYEPYGYKIPVVTRGKNLFNCNDEPTLSKLTKMYTISNLDINKYYTCSTSFEKIPEVPLASLYFAGESSLKNGVWKDTPRTFKPDTNGQIAVYVRHATSEGAPAIFDKVISGEITVMIEEGTTATPYEPYHEPITTPIYLPTPLYSGEVMRSDGTITRSDGTTETFTAPQIPTLNGTTVIDVDTAVKPTEMYTKYKSSK